jgi:hypothetical protein
VILLAGLPANLAGSPTTYSAQAMARFSNTSGNSTEIAAQS